MSEFINTIDVLGDEVLTDSLIEGTITEFKDDKLTKIGPCGLAFQGNLKKVILPNVTVVDEQAFSYSGALEVIDLASVVYFGNWALQRAGIDSLIAIIIRNEEQVPAVDTQFINTISTFSNGVGYLYVPKTLEDAYKEDASWSRWADRVRALEDYTVDGTITGELDDTKI